MIQQFFHAWERRLVAVTTDRVVRPFEWGLDWIDDVDHSQPPGEALRAWASRAVSDSDRFYDTASIAATDFTLDGDRLSFPSAFKTPHHENNTVRARYFPADQPSNAPKRAVVVLPQWNADPDGHVGLSQLIAKFGLSAVRLSLPYHDNRMPSELQRADYIVSANIGRTIQVCRQAVLDTRRTIDWLITQGYEDIGLLGTSLGSCLAMLTATHDPRISVAALNHISPYFADVVWDGLSTAHVREGLDAGIDLELLRQIWLPISPAPYLERMRGKKTLLVYARYDLSFPVTLSQQLVRDFRNQGFDPEVFVLPCGHYSTGKAPFSWIDGFILIRFLRRAFSLS
ncbi:MAG: abhydrolase domain-containing 18 [Acidobacteriota bacterium]|nr:abhydrolase domain-containing 18 [Acidobacteriota bacterium]